jgi:small subunit ribosomal protein S8
MTMTDPIADLLTRIRNGLIIDRERVSIPHSKVKEEICRVLKEEGFINDYRLTDEEKHKTLHVFLKYGPDGEKVINEIKRTSKPGCRVYRGTDDLPRVLNGLGIAVVSTPKGVMSDRQARDAHVGGEVICTVW